MLNSNSRTSNCRSEVVMSLTYCFDNENKEQSIHLESNTKPNLDQSKAPINTIFAEKKTI